MATLPTTRRSVAALLLAVMVPLLVGAEDELPLHWSRDRSYTGERCGHGRYKDLPGYGINAPVAHVPYAVNTSDRSPENRRRMFRQQGSSNTTSSSSSNTSVWSKLRISYFFDSGNCSASAYSPMCGHCVAANQTITTYENMTSTTVCTEADILTPAKLSYIMDVLLPGAVQFYENTLSVVPVVGNLVVPISTCGAGPGTPVPLSHQTTGIPRHRHGPLHHRVTGSQGA